MKGLCVECASDLNFALACRGRHEDQARRLSNIQLRLGLMLPLFLVAMGLLFASWGFLSDPSSLFMIIFGVGLVLLAIAFLIRGKASLRKSA